MLRRARPSRLTFHSAWFCPYAHRATLALEHHADALEWDWEESLGWEARASTVGEEADGRTEEHYYHWKSEGLLKANPTGMVPALVEQSTGRVVSESLVCIEFIDEYAAQAGKTAGLLMPDDAAERARTRLWAARVNRECCSPYYDILCKTDAEGRRAAHAALLDGLRRFSAEIPGGGPFFAGADVGAVDFALLPWAYRYYVLPYYKGEEFAIPREPALEPFHAWLEAMVARPQVARTLPEKDRYLKHIGKYAAGSARSKVANAVRRGASAHEIDDQLDG